MIVTYDTHVVAFSVFSAVITSYVVLNLAGNTVASGRARHLWLAGGAIAIGTGIWWVYFIIMLANKLAISMESDSLITVAVLGIAIIASGLAVYSFSRQQADKLQFLIESQRRMATLIDSIPGIVFSCSNELGWPKTYLSEGCLNLTGYQSEELLASETTSYNAITHPEDLSKVLQTIETAITKQQPYVVEYRIFTISGQLKWLSEKGSGIFNNKGEVLGIEGFISDITEHKRAEAAFDNSKKRLHAQNTALMTLTRSKTLSFEDLNTAVREITEVATNTLGIARTSVWLYNTERSKIRCIDLYELNTSRHSQGIELAAVDYPCYFQALNEERTLAAHDAHTDPRTKEFSQSYLSQLGITSMLDAPIWLRGEMIGVVCHEHIGAAREWALEEQNFAGSIADLVSMTMEACERKQAEEAVRQAEAKYRSIFEHTIEGIFQTTPDGQYISANPALAQIYGYQSPEELIANLRNIEQQLYVEPNKRTEFTYLMEQHHFVSGFESQIYRRDGAIIWISENARAIRNACGAVICYEGTVEDITQRKQTEVQLAYLANHDPLTGLFNRRHFREHLEHHLALLQCHNHCGVLLFIDLDDFKTINDTWGHEAGDELLQCFASLLQQHFRKTDILGRLGGDEFVILLPQISLTEAKLIVQRLLNALEDHVVIANSQQVRISASIGATLFPFYRMTADELLAHADVAMYKSKASNGNCLSIYTPEKALLS